MIVQVASLSQAESPHVDDFVRINTYSLQGEPMCSCSGDPMPIILKADKASVKQVDARRLKCDVNTLLGSRVCSALNSACVYPGLPMYGFPGQAIRTGPMRGNPHVRL